MARRSEWVNAAPEPTSPTLRNAVWPQALAIALGLGGVVPALWSGFLSGWARGALATEAALAVALSIALLLRRSASGFPSSHIRLALFFCFVAFASCASALVGGNPDLYKSLTTLVGGFLWVSPYFASYYLLRSTRTAVLAWDLLVLVGAVISGTIYVSKMTGFGEVVGTVAIDRAFGPLGDNVGFISCSFACEALVRRRYILFAFHAGAILLTGTRGAVFALASGVAWLIVEWLRGTTVRHRASTVIRLVAVLVCLVPLAFTTPFASTRDRLRDMDAGIGSRWGAVSIGLGVVKSSPIFGVGYGQFRQVAAQQAATMNLPSNEANFERGTFYTQNQLVQTATDGGVGAAILLLAFLWHLFHKLDRPIKGNPDANLRRVAARVVFVATVLGNQSAIWLNFGCTSGYFMLLLAGIGERITSLAEFGDGNRSSRRLAPRPRGERQ